MAAVELELELVLKHEDVFLVDALPIVVESEDDSPDIRDVYLSCWKPGVLLTGPDGEWKPAEDVRLSLGERYSDPILSGIAAAAWRLARANTTALEDKWAEENREEASDYYVDPVREYGTLNARAL